MKDTGILTCGFNSVAYLATYAQRLGVPKSCIHRCNKRFKDPTMLRFLRENAQQRGHQP